MLQQMKQVETPSGKTYREPVTPEEVANAITELEHRQFQEDNQQQATNVVNTVVQELQLNVTPEQVLAEIQARRSDHRASARTRRISGYAAMKWFLTLSLATNCFLVWNALAARQSRAVGRKNIIRSSSHSQALISNQPRIAPATSGRLSEAQESDYISADIYAMRRLTRGVSPSDVEVVLNIGKSDSDWELHKENGKIQVTVWATPANHTSATSGKTATVFSTQRPGCVSFTLSLSTFDQAKIEQTATYATAMINNFGK